MRKSDHTADGMRWYSEHSHGYSEYSHCRTACDLTSAAAMDGVRAVSLGEGPAGMRWYSEYSHGYSEYSHGYSEYTHILTLSTHTADGVRAVPLGEGPAGSATAEPPNRRRRDHT
jgi:hypothetical protein